MKVALLLFVLLLSSITLAQVSTVDYGKVEQSSANALNKFFSTKAEIFVGGTEYARGIDTDGKIFANIVLGNFTLDNANCLTTVYYPDNSGKFLDGSSMTFIEKGMYYKDFSISNNMQLGVYPVLVECYYPVNHTFYNASAYQVYNGTYTSGSLANTVIYDGVSLRFTEAFYATGVRTLNVSLNMSANMTNLTENVNIEFGGEWNGGAGAANEEVKISIFNFTGNKWVELLNHVVDAIPQSPVNVTNTIPRPFSDFFNNSNFFINFEDIPVGSDGANSILDIDHLQIDVLNNATIIPCIVRGTTEVHVSENIVLKLLKTDINETIVSNHNVCADDNITLIHVLSKVRCVDDVCIDITENVTEVCNYGCDLTSYPPSCNPSTSQAGMWFFIIIIICVILMVFLIRWATKKF